MSGMNASVVEFSGMAAGLFPMMEVRRKQGEGTAPMVVVTSALAGEGKSFVAEGLSAHLARLSARRILLVDANLARPSATVRFRAAGRTGLAELLSAESTEFSAPLEPGATPIDNLGVLGAGRAKPDSTVLFREGALARLVAWATPRCDLCVIDAGPLSEPGAALLVDGAMQGVLVVDSRRTTHRAAAGALERSGGKARRGASC